LWALRALNSSESVLICVVKVGALIVSIETILQI
jgi:hypothetical protein